MKVRIVCYEDVDLWILGKFATKLRENLLAMGTQADIAKVPDPTADINHHIIYFDYDGRKNSTDTVMITHLDSDWKVDKVRAQLGNAELGICMSAETARMLESKGVPGDRLCHVLPAHDGVMRPRPINIGLTSKIHGDGRKREHLLPRLASGISSEDFRFTIMGAGWEGIVDSLRALGFSVEYHDAFDHELNRRLVPQFDHYLYLGLDEGAMGFVDALAAGVPTIATPQGYHLDAPGGLVAPFTTFEELEEVFRRLSDRRSMLTESVKTWTWRDYAAKHLELWEYLLAGRNRTGASRYRDGLNSLLGTRSTSGSALAAQNVVASRHPQELFRGSALRSKEPVVTPPRAVLPSQVGEYTMDGRASQESWYLDESRPSGGSMRFDAAGIETLRERIRRRELGSYGITDDFLYQALDKFDLKGLDVVVIGSEFPWYESMCLEAGARSITTIEYRQVSCAYPGMTFLTPDEFRRTPRVFDAALSISSFEHDGLARYGDPLDPNADLAAMQDMKALVKPGGLLYLAVPMGRDILVWNAHRIYGRNRFPLLVKGWTTLGWFGADETIYDHPTIGSGEERNYIQPVVVLRNDHPESRVEVVDWKSLDRVPEASRNRTDPAAASRPRILVVADVPGWIFDRHAHKLQSELADEFDIEIAYQGQDLDESRHDLVYALEWNLVSPDRIRTRSKWVAGIRSHITWQDLPAEVFKQALARFSRVHVVSRRLESLLSGYHPRLGLLTHGIDLEHFLSSPRQLGKAGSLRIGWAGNRKSPAKGFEQFIDPLGKIPGVELEFCGYSDHLLDFKEMRAFYEDIDVYVCSSSTEGSNNSLLEAAAMGCAIVTTDVGTVPEYLEDGVSALIVDRTPESFRNAVLRLLEDPALVARLGSEASRSVKSFDWKLKLRDHRRFFHLALGEAAGASSTPEESAADKAERLLRDSLDYIGKGELEMALALVSEGARLAPEKEGIGRAEAGLREAIERRRGSSPKVQELLEVADRHLAAKEYEPCILALRLAEELAPDPRRIVEALAWVFVQKGDVQSAHAQYIKASQLWPDDPGTHANLAGLRIQMGLVERAEPELRKVLRLAPHDAEALVALSRIHRERGEESEADALISELRRHHPGHPAARESATPSEEDRASWNPTFSFCIITNGKRPEKLRDEIRSIRELEIPGVRILVGGEPPEGFSDPGVEIVAVVDAARNGRLGEMRNRLVERTDSDIVVVADDDMLFHPDFRDGIVSAGPDFDVLCPRLLNPNGSRYWDWAVFRGHGEENHHLIPYGDSSPDVYVTGGLCVARRGVFEVAKWDEGRGFYQEEDIDFSARLKKAGLRIGCAPGATVTHRDPRHVQWGREALDLRAVVGRAAQAWEAGEKEQARAALRLAHANLAGSGYPPELAVEVARAIGDAELLQELSSLPPLRLGFDGRTFSVPDSVVRGIGNYALHHLLAVLAARPGCDLTVLTDDHKPFPDAIRSRLQAAGAKFAPWSTRTAEDFDIFHASDPMHVHPEFAAPFHRFGSTRSSATFYDIIPMRVYEGRIANWPGYLARLDQMRACGTELHCISEFTRRDLLSATSFDPSKVRVVMAGFNGSESSRCWTREEGDAVLSRLGIDKPFFLHVGAVDPHKNFETALAAVQAISRTRPVQLVVAGRLANSLESVRQQVLRIGMRDVVFTDYLPREELELLYSRAVATLFLSRYEGFGFPALEAMANGCPLVCSDATSLPEVVGNAALLHAPDDLAGVVSSLERLLDDPGLRASLVSAGRRQARAFPWSSVADRTWQAWDELAKGPAPAPQTAPPPAAVAWVSPVWDPSGYGDESRAFVRHLAGTDLGLGLLAWGRHSESFRQAADSDDRSLFDGLMGRETASSPVAVLDMPGSALGRVPGAGHHVGRTTFETDGLPGDWIDRCDSMDELWVPSSFNLETFRRAGVRKPVLVVPEGVDTARFRPGTEPLSLPGPKRATTFLSVFEWTHRKGPDVLLRAWAMAFGPDEDVRLVLRTYPPNEIEGDPAAWVDAKIEETLREAGSSRDRCASIVAMARQVPESDMPRLYAAADVLVAPSRGEGWGRPHMEAMSSGVPVIATRWSGNLDFQDDDNSWLVDTEGLEEIDAREEFPSYRGQKWAKPSADHLSRLLRAALDPDVRLAKGARARQDMVERWDWSRIAPMAEARIREILDGIPAERSSLSTGRSAGAAPVVHPFSVPKLLPALRGRIPIAMPAYNRDDYLQQVLAGLRSNVDLERFFLVTGEEPDCPGTKALFDSVDWMPVVRTINPRRLGCRGNVLGTIDRAFEFADRAVVLEDDIVPAPDFLSYLLWGLDRFRDDQGVFDIAAYRRLSEEPPRGDAHLANRVSWFTPWGWATWKDRWTRFRDMVPIPADAPDSWGSWACRWSVEIAKLQEIRPLVGRAQNIGEVGTWVPNPEWHRDNQRTVHWMGSLGWPSIEPRAFRLDTEVEAGRVPPSPETTLPTFRWCGDLFNFSGYAGLARNAVAGLMDAGMPVTADPQRNDRNWFPGIPPADRTRWTELLSRNPKTGVLVCCDVPRDATGRNQVFDRMAAANPGNPRRVGWTMFESDRLPAGWADSLNRLDEVWVPSEFNRRTFSAAGVEPGRIHVVPGSVDPSRYGSGLPHPLPGGRKGTTFLSVFQWVRRKGWDVLLRAWADAFDPKADVRLVLRCHPSGNDASPMRERFRESLEELGLAESKMAPIVLLDGFVPESEMPSLFLASDVFVLPSRGEGWGLPYLEAMASGKPCIATAWGASMDFLNEDNAWLASPRDLVPVGENACRENPYLSPDHRWADPDPAEVAQLLRRAASNIVERERKGIQARFEATTRWNPENTSSTIAARGRALLGLPEPASTRTFPPVRNASGTKLSGTMEKVAAGLLAHRVEHATTTAPEPEKPLSIRWEGSQFVHHSLALVNRELCLRLAKRGHDLSLIPWEPDQFGPGDDPDLAILERLRKAPLEGPCQVHVRHQWPPLLERPEEGKWVVVQPWEFGSPPQDWMPVFRDRIDALWVPSTYCRDLYARAGVPADRIRVVPNGVDADRFRPGLQPLPGLEPDGRVTFLYVGGTIARKGFDVLLNAWKNAFGPSDPVRLVVKAMGGETFYKGQTGEAMVQELNASGTCAPVVYVDQDLSLEDLPRIYASGDVLVHPYRGEGFGLPIAEAMSCGLPVVVTRGGASDDFCGDAESWGIPATRVDVPGGVVGPFRTVAAPWWLEPSAEKLAEILRTVAGDEVGRRSRGKAGRRRILSNWTWEHAADAVEAALRDVAARPGVRREGEGGKTPDAPPPDAASAAELLDLNRILFRAEAAAGRGEFGEAEVATREAVEAHPDQPLAWLARAMVLRGLRKFPSSIEAVRKSIALQESPDALLESVLIHRLAGQDSQAKTSAKLLKERHGEWLAATRALYATKGQPWPLDTPQKNGKKSNAPSPKGRK
ncbi:MAG TPA: glycosyltransferase [Fibrobacteria bacterium]|nr:glycosyltransferase [Fibrobacteria bacterium]